MRLFQGLLDGSLFSVGNFRLAPMMNLSGKQNYQAVRIGDGEGPVTSCCCRRTVPRGCYEFLIEAEDEYVV